MIRSASLLVTLVSLVDRLPRPVPPAPRGRGRPRVYADALFLKALVIMIVRHLHSPGELLTVLQQPTDEMQALRPLLTQDGHFPSRRTWERRLAALPTTLPAQIGCLGRHLVGLIQPWLKHGRAAAIDSTLLRAKGGVWHKKHRDAGVVPHTSIDTQAGWTRSGWHGWVYGWKLHLICTAGEVWIPLAAELTPANVGDNTQAPALLREMPGGVPLLLGDQQYRDPDLDQLCQERGCFLITPRGGRYPHADEGAAVRGGLRAPGRRLGGAAAGGLAPPPRAAPDGRGPVGRRAVLRGPTPACRRGQASLT